MLSHFVDSPAGAFENMAMTETDERRRGSVELPLHVLTNSNTGAEYQSPCQLFCSDAYKQVLSRNLPTISVN